MRHPTPSPTRELCPCCGRRDFLVTSFSAAALLMLTRTFGRAADALPGMASAATGPITNVIPFAATPLPLSAVRLTGGPLQKAQELGCQNLLRLDMDRLVYRFRQRADLDPKASDGYGSWEGPGRQLTGAMAGHYLSAVSYMSAATGDAEFKRRTDYMVNEFKEVQDKQGDGYIGALMGNPPRGSADTGPIDGKLCFQALTTGDIRASAFDLNGMWSPWYVQHKIFAGLRDAYRQTGNKTALDLSVKFAAWVDSIVGGLTDQQFQRMLGAEFGGINESFADLYADTGDTRWLKLSQRFRHNAIVNPLADHQDILAGKHGNTTVPKLLGELVRYVDAGTPDGDAAKFFWDAVVAHHTFATGGHGYDEAFGPADQLSSQVDGTGQRNADRRTCESCNVYNMVKMTRLLFALSPDNKFAEFHERALFNHVLGSINFDDGQVCYMVPVGQGQTHEYQGLTGMTCCCGTGLENHALHGYGLYYTSADKLWVNIYAPSTASWKEKGFTLDVEVDNSARDSDFVVIKFTADAPKEFSLMLRRPSWAGQGFAVDQNGVAMTDLSSTGNYVEIKKEWKAGDRVGITLPKSLYKETLPDNPNRAALKWGPYVLAADFGPPNAPVSAQAIQAAANSVGGGAGASGIVTYSTPTAANASGSGVATPAATGGNGGGRRGGRGRAGPPVKYPVFLAKADEPVSNWLKAVTPMSPVRPDATGDVPVSFHATGVGGDNNQVSFQPFYQLSGRRYGIYQDIYTVEEWAARNAPPTPAVDAPAGSTPA